MLCKKKTTLNNSENPRLEVIFALAGGGHFSSFLMYAVVGRCSAEP
jgi:hypothetical protein